MSSKVAIVVGIVVVVALGAWVLTVANGDDSATESDAQEQREEDAREANEDVAETTSVVYTDDGFEPATIRISQGETVTWENQASVPMFVASDPHPAHTDLPELEADVNTEPGETYEFTFEEAGVWGYHDHLNSFRTGTVIVE